MVSTLTVPVYLVNDSSLHLCRRSTLTGLSPRYRSGIHTEDLRHRFVRKPSMHAIKPELVSESFRPLVRTVSEKGYDRSPVVNDRLSFVFSQFMSVKRSTPSLRATSASLSPESNAVRARVERARKRQMDRAGKPSQALTPSELDHTCPLNEAAHRLMSRALQRIGLSARAYHRVLKVARTIADLAGSESIVTTHLSEAIGYRRLDRTGPPRH
jgi:hypothetical protein